LRLRVQRRFRLTRSEDFKRVRRSGKSYAHPLVVLIVQAHEQPHARTRVGIAAGRTVGTAVRRNRAKRLLREAMRSLLPGTATNVDLLLIARPALASAALEEARAALQNLLQRANLFVPLHES
jgi:ribonuclease P protein component